MMKRIIFETKRRICGNKLKAKKHIKKKIEANDIASYLKKKKKEKK